MKERRKTPEKRDDDEFLEKVKQFEIVGKEQPWGIFFKAVPDLNHNFNVNDLPQETFEPPPTPKGRLREQINYLTIDLQYAIKNKLIKDLEKLV